MKLHFGHRVVIALTGLAIGLRFLMPAHMLNWLNPRVFGPQVDLTATLLQVLGILFIGGTLFFIMPVVWAPNAPRKLAIAGLVWLGY